MLIQLCVRGAQASHGIDKEDRASKRVKPKKIMNDSYTNIKADIPNDTAPQFQSRVLRAALLHGESTH